MAPTPVRIPGFLLSHPFAAVLATYPYLGLLTPEDHNLRPVAYLDVSTGLLVLLVTTLPFLLLAAVGLLFSPLALNCSPIVPVLGYSVEVYIH